MSSYDIDLSYDVLVIGGSLAGAWAALSAREAGASVAIVDKAWIGAAGVVAASTGGGYFLLPDDPEQRERTIRIRHPQADGLDDLAFCERVYEQSYRTFLKFSDWGFRMGRFGSFRGPDAMVFLRNRMLRQGVKLLDHSPALELLATAEGVVAGAAGVQRKIGKSWRVRAGAVILATGGNAFKSGAIGTGGSTGDGYLFGAEAGVTATGMEFSAHYAFVAEGSSCTKGGMFHMYGQIFDEDGNKLDPEPGWPAVPAAGRAMMAGKKVFGQIDVEPEAHARVQSSMPNFFTYFERNHLEPFNHRWRLGLVFEGTVRASGGLVVGDDGSTATPGLWAVGDVTDKSKLTGAQMSGAGAAIAWCVASGEWAGSAAAGFAAELGVHHTERNATGLGGIGLRPAGAPNAASIGRIDQAVRDEILPVERSLYKDAPGIEAAIGRLGQLWTDARSTLGGDDVRGQVRAREAAAMLLSARWINHAALERRETRGLHRRTDYPGCDPAQRHRLIVGGLDTVAVTTAELASSESIAA